MATNVDNVSIINDKTFEDLFIRNIVPPWWNCNSQITYQFCNELFQNCVKYKEVLDLNETTIIQNALKCLDSSVILPSSSNFKFFKRKVVTKCNSKNNAKNNDTKNQPMLDLYNKSQNVIGPNSEAIGLSISAFTNIAYGNNDNCSYEIKAKCVFSNKLVLELFRYYSATKDISIKHLCKVIYF